MKVHLIRKETIEVYIVGKAGIRTSFEDWIEKIKHADWEKPMDMKQTFRTIDLLGKHSNRAVFDIGGNAYRMICKYAFGDRQVHLFICWIGTHSEYDELCNKRKQFTISNY